MAKRGDEREDREGEHLPHQPHRTEDTQTRMRLALFVQKHERASARRRHQRRQLAVQHGQFGELRALAVDLADRRGQRARDPFRGLGRDPFALVQGAMEHGLAFARKDLAQPGGGRGRRGWRAVLHRAQQGRHRGMGIGLLDRRFGHWRTPHNGNRRPARDERLGRVMRRTAPAAPLNCTIE